jgi:hypothetical protein
MARKIASPRALCRLFACVGLTLVLTGCVAIKSQTASQRLPGVVTLDVQVCVSDHDHSTYDDCVPGANTAENDNGTDGDDLAGQPVIGNGQLLLGFRVPDGTTAPASFPSVDGRVIFSASPGYASALTAEYVPVAGFHWVGYLSTSTSFNAQVQDNRLTAVRPEFVLPEGAAPFAGPFRWRVVAGSRQNSATVPANAPINCSVGSESCFDSPTLSTTSGRATLSHLTTPVSDYAVLAAPAATAGHGQTATFTFPLQDSDGANKGPLPVTLSATTTLPGASPQLGAATAAIPRNGQATANVSVPVPAGTALGNYAVTLTAGAGQGVARSRTATLTVIDALLPQISIGTPADGATFVQGQPVKAAYSCQDEFNGSGVASCTGPVAPGAVVDTSAPGPHSFTVTATDTAGNTATRTSTYTVTPAAAAQINVAVSFDFRSSTTKATKFTSLAVKNVPKGATVSATCKGKGCPAKRVKGKRRIVSFTKHNASGTVSLTPWAKRSLRVGTVLRIVVTKPGAIGAIKTLTVRPRKAPKVETQCLQAGSTTRRVACR